MTARVIGKDPSVWWSTVTINKGSGDGVRVDQPVVTGEGLVGRVTFTTGSTAVVTLVTDHSTYVPARINEPPGVDGGVAAETGRPDDLLMNYTRRQDRVDPGQTVVTVGHALALGPLPLALPAEHPDRPRDERREPGHRRPARPPAALRRPAPPRVRPGPDQGPEREPARAVTSAVAPQLVAAPGRARAADRHRPGRGGVADPGLRRQRRPPAARRGRRRPAVRLDERARSSASAWGSSPTWRSCRRWALSSLLYLAVGYWAGRAARAARPAGRARPDRGRRRGDRGGDDRLLDHAVPARRRRARQLRCSCARSSPRSCSTRVIAAAVMRRSSAGCSAARCPRTRAAAGARAYTTGGLSPLERSAG